MNAAVYADGLILGAKSILSTITVNLKTLQAQAQSINSAAGSLFELIKLWVIYWIPVVSEFSSVSGGVSMSILI